MALVRISTMEFWTPSMRQDQKSMKQQDNERFLRIQKRLFGDDVGRRAFKLFNEKTDNCELTRTCHSCGKICRTTSIMHHHEGNEECKKQECKNKGLEYTPPPLPKCEICDKFFKSTYGLTKHMTTARHKKAESDLKNESKAYSCSVCDKKFSSKKTYKYHLGTDSHNELTELSKLGKLTVGDRSFHCSVCNKSFGSIKTYKQHTLRASHLKRLENTQKTQRTHTCF